MSVAGRDGLIEDMAKRHLRILQIQIDGLWDNLIAFVEGNQGHGTPRLGIFPNYLWLFAPVAS